VFGGDRTHANGRDGKNTSPNRTYLKFILREIDRFLIHLRALNRHNTVL
jgi:hypothetical protein